MRIPVPILALAAALPACTIVTEKNQYAFAGEDYHPGGYERPERHGPDSNLRVEDCRLCHGDDLRGGVSGGSCDACHQDGWREDCTYCHGGLADESGSPPRDIDGNDDPEAITFPPHPEHTSGADHRALPCSECHVQPDDVLSNGHNFVGDDSVAVAEVDFSGGISPGATWDGASCSTVYCHGDGQDDKKQIKLTRSDLSCDGGCHAGPGSGGAEWALMSGQHYRHIASEGFPCSECHGATVNAAGEIVGPEKHVNGKPNVVMPAGITWNHGTCTGSCHDESHNSRIW